MISWINDIQRMHYIKHREQFGDNAYSERTHAAIFYTAAALTAVVVLPNPMVASMQARNLVKSFF
jgi:uncharacterized membrane protein YjgN (DUF898 family)